jgi:gamma-glutamyltranspeptidase/glutathione hydrolase
MPVMTLFRRAALPMAALFTITACSTVSDLGNTFFGGGGSVDAARVKGFLGAVVADEPNAALAGREVLALGGTAADAAVAVGLTLAVTYPSRASLGAGGACLAYSPAKTSPGAGSPEAIVFTPVAPTTVLPRTDRPAAIPMLARGLFALHARYGRRPFETLISPAEQLARFGTPASRAFVRDLTLVAGPLMADPNARAVFAPGGVPLKEGSTMVQPDLGGTLSQLRTVGVGDLYQGTLGHRLEQASALAGGGLTLADMRAALPKTLTPIVMPAGNDNVAFLPPPADGGLAAAASFRALQQNAGAVQAAKDRGLAVAAAWRAGGADAAKLLAGPAPPAAPLPPLPASTSFATLDRDGDAVVCVVTMDNLFGTGRIAPGTGIVLAASPAGGDMPLLAAAIAWNSNVRGFRAEVGGTGQDGAPLAVAVGMHNALHSSTAMPAPVPDPGRADVISCSRYLPDADNSCSWAGDPREAGLAAGSN